MERSGIGRHPECGDARYFAFPRRSDLPYGYFDQLRRRRRHALIGAAVCALAVILLVVAATHLT